MKQQAKTMSKLSRRVFLGMSAAAATVAFGACSRTNTESAGNSPAATENQEVNLYSSRHYNTDQQLYDNFTRQTGIKVNLIEGEADPLIQRIQSEGSNSPADVFITVDAGRLWRAYDAGIFAPIDSKILEQNIPAYLREPQGHWFGFSQRLRPIMYNKDKVDPSQLSTYEDLADPKWKGKIIMRPSSNIYNQSLVAWLITRNGAEATEEWVRGLASNFARPPQGNDVSQLQDVAAGVGDLTLANTYYLANMADSEDPAKQEIYEKIGVFFPDPTHGNISGGGVVKTAPNKEAAIKFLEYLASPEAQEFFAQGNNEYPVVEGVPMAAALQKWGKHPVSKTNIADYAPKLGEAVEMMNRAGWK